MVGGGSGGIIGASAGHLSSLGGVPGALIGTGLGAAAGAVMSERYYEDDAPIAAEAPDTRQIDRLSEQLEQRQAQVTELKRTLEEEEAQKQALLEAHEKVSGELAELRDSFGPDVAVSRDSEGTVKLTILSELLFDSGKAGLTGKGKAVLSQTAETIRREFPNSTVEVRGHTDDVPIRYSKYESNWELSCARALSVLHHLVEAEKFPADRMMAVGLADTRPVSSNDTAEGRRTNRRAEIIIRSSIPEPERNTSASLH
jgi:chemotaxis protein MotB